MFEPPVYEKPLAKPLEALAQRLVASGRMRVDAYEKINFIRYPALGADIFFSYRELFDPKLFPATEKIIGKNSLELLRKEISNNRPVAEETEIKLARLLLQSAHPAVIELMLIERVEVFISYSHNISDLLDFTSWQEQGSNSGMQSVGLGARVFVSSDGDPFNKDEDAAENTKYSMARLMVIAGQEIGHFSDLRRNRHGAPVARFSLDNWRYPSSVVADARKKDLVWGKKVEEIFHYLGLNENARLEKSISYFKKHKRQLSLNYITAIIKSFLATKTLQRRAEKFNVKIAHLHDARHLAIMLADMRFNLTPRAGVYERDDPREQEGIMCVEALARVPQQVVKWGHKTTEFMYPNLYRFYYNKVIPANIEVVKNLKSKTGR